MGETQNDDKPAKIRRTETGRYIELLVHNTKTPVSALADFSASLEVARVNPLRGRKECSMEKGAWAMAGTATVFFVVSTYQLSDCFEIPRVSYRPDVDGVEANG